MRSDSILGTFNRDSLSAQRFQTLITSFDDIKFEVSLKVEEAKLWTLAFYITRQEN